MQTRSAAAGVKRHADESSLNDDQRFAKRFNLLSLVGPAQRQDGNSNLYIPIPNPNLAPAQNGLSHAGPARLDGNGRGSEEAMQVDDTRDRVYIHDLDEELAGIESDEERLIFLPDIEKRLSRIPKQVLTGDREDAENQELVLYSVPKSLTVDEGQDSVRKAIIEARQRARDRAAEEARQEDMIRKYDQSDHPDVTETAHGYSSGYEEQGSDPDPDAMDLG